MRPPPCWQMMRVHAASVDTLLEEAILQSTSRTADEQARREVRQQADTINTLALQFQPA